MLKSFSNLKILVNSSYISKVKESDAYLRKGYIFNIAIEKPFYAEGNQKFYKIYSIVAAVNYGKISADGALQDINDQKNPVSFTVTDFLTPIYMEDLKKATIFNIGAGIQQTFHFGKTEFSIAGVAGYQKIERPSFTLIDKTLTNTTNGDNIIYAISEKTNASGIFFKPAFNLGYWITSQLVISTNLSYTFGTSFKGIQSTWQAKNSNGDRYFNGDEIKAGNLVSTAFQKPVNYLCAGLGLKFVIR